VTSAKKTRGRQLLEQRLSSYRRNPDFFATTGDAASAIRRVEDDLRQLNEFVEVRNVDLPADQSAEMSNKTKGEAAKIIPRRS
jgi:hypothetical protein